MSLPGPPPMPGGPINYGDYFTFQDYLKTIERIQPDTPYETARELFDQVCNSGLAEVVGALDSGDFIYRCVPPEERKVRVVVLMREL